MGVLPKPSEADASGPARVRWWRSSGFKLTLASLGVLLVFAVALAFNSSRLIRAALDHDMGKQTSQMSRLINLTIAPYAAEGQLDLLQDYVRELLSEGKSDTGLVYLVVIDSHNKQLVSAGSLARGALPPPSRDIADAMREGVMHVRQPVLLSSNDVGSLQYGLGIGGFKQLLNGLLRDGLLILTLSFLFAAVFFGLTGYRLSRRLSRLVTAAQAISGGNYSKRVVVGGHDEYAELALAFNTMALAIDERIEALERSQREVSELNEHLEQRVTERTHELAERNTQLSETIETLNHTRQRLVRTEKLAGLGKVVVGVAHELNTPIGNAKVIASALEGRTDQMRNALALGLKRSELSSYLEGTEESARLLVANLDRAAELVVRFRESAADRREAERRSFDAVEALKDVAVLARIRAERSDIETEVIADGTIMVDSYPAMWERMLLNCLANCYQHAFAGHSGGKIRISADADKQRITIRIQDNGCGISPEHLERIFDPFFTTALGQGGSGLGLHSVYNIVTGVLDGEVAVSSEVGTGTLLTIEIPRRTPD
ncbi:ATP-binding protein [Niveibacterium sp. 24ML]|uniref:sensor histidine kinase n=1 Tax=Niveibacterium sp. 24ML TaxID=2985512 RepID=UPI00226ECB5F|nr:ATP-binding protein [Niveibacterium sp. 24ML]MCX9155860.1 ATP-binding protein [Niveibacterium sp. 24ML]